MPGLTNGVPEQDDISDLAAGIVQGGDIDFRPEKEPVSSQKAAKAKPKQKSSDRPKKPILKIAAVVATLGLLGASYGVKQGKITLPFGHSDTPPVAMPAAPAPAMPGQTVATSARPVAKQVASASLAANTPFQQMAQASASVPAVAAPAARAPVASPLPVATIQPSRQVVTPPAKSPSTALAPAPAVAPKPVPHPYQEAIPPTAVKPKPVTPKSDAEQVVELEKRVRELELALAQKKAGRLGADKAVPHRKPVEDKAPATTGKGKAVSAQSVTVVGVTDGELTLRRGGKDVSMHVGDRFVNGETITHIDGAGMMVETDKGSYKVHL